MSTQPLTAVKAVKPEGAILRKLHVLLRDTLSAGEHVDLTDEVAAAAFGASIARIQAMINGQLPVELPEKVRVMPIQEKKEEKMRTRVQFFVSRDKLREAKDALRTAYQLNYMPSARATEDPNVATLSIYFVRFTPAERFYANNRDLFLDLKCHGEEVAVEPRA
jgi:hypothetical protein